MLLHHDGEREQELNKGPAYIGSAHEPAQVLVHQLIKLELGTGNTKTKQGVTPCQATCFVTIVLQTSYSVHKHVP